MGRPLLIEAIVFLSLYAMLAVSAYNTRATVRQISWSHRGLAATPMAKPASVPADRDVYNPTVAGQFTAYRVTRHALGSMWERAKYPLTDQVGFTQSWVSRAGRADAVPNGRTHGDFWEEDCRLVEWGVHLLCLVSRNYCPAPYDRPNSMAYIAIDKHTLQTVGRGEFVLPSQPNGQAAESHTEKNWMPFKSLKGELLLVQRLDPLRILRVPPDFTPGRNVQTEEVPSEHGPLPAGVPQKLRGSTQFVQVVDSRDRRQLLVGIGHTKTQLVGFLHHVVVMTGRPPYRLLHVSRPFVFSENNVRVDIPHLGEYASGIELVGSHRVRITFGLDNKRPFEVVVGVHEMLAMARNGSGR